MMFRKALWPSDGNVDAIIHAAPTKCGLDYFSDHTTDESVIAKWNARAGVAQDAVRAAAERVCWFDWSDNDMDAVAAIDALRKAITSSVPSTVQRRPDETGDEYEARVGLIPSKDRGET